MVVSELKLVVWRAKVTWLIYILDWFKMGMVWWTEVPGICFYIAEIQVIRLNFFVFRGCYVLLCSSVPKYKRPCGFQCSLLLCLSFLTIKEAWRKQLLLNLFLARNAYSIAARYGPYWYRVGGNWFFIINKLGLVRVIGNLNFLNARNSQLIITILVLGGCWHKISSWLAWKFSTILLHFNWAISIALRGCWLNSLSGWWTNVPISLRILLEYLFIWTSLLWTFSGSHERCFFNSNWGCLFYSKIRS